MNFAILMPEMVVALTAIAVLIAGWYWGGAERNRLPMIALIGLISSLGVLVGWHLAGSSHSAYGYFGGIVTTDFLSWVFRVMILIAAIGSLGIAWRYSRRAIVDSGDFLALMLLATLGAMLLVMSEDLLMLFLSIELLSICSYLMTGWRKEKAVSNEAALKYLLFGAFASALLLYGTSLLFGLLGTTQFDAIAKALATVNPDTLQPVWILALMFLTVGLLYKVAAFPMHFWAPDVYEGAPLPVVAFLGTVSKLAGFGLLVRLMLLVFQVEWTRDLLTTLIAVVAAASMLIGNGGALVQKNIKRLLAYSGIAQVGYLMIAVVVLGTKASNDAAIWILYGLLVYILTFLGVIAIIVYFAEGVESTHIADLSGLGKVAPLPAFCLSCCLMSLAGLPPLAGFTAKLFIFGIAIKMGFVWLAVIGAVTSLFAIYYYLRIIRVMYFETAEEDRLFSSPSIALQATACTCLAGILLLFIYPDPAIQFMSQVVSRLHASL